MSEISYGEKTKRWEVEDAVAFFGDVNPNNQSLVPYHLNVLEQNLEQTGWPVVTVKPGNKKQELRGKARLAFLWRDEETSLLMYRRDAETACRWFDEYTRSRKNQFQPGR